MSNLVLIAMLAAQAAAPPAPATPPAEWSQGEWVEMARQGEVRVELDTSALRRDGDKLRVRVRGEIPETSMGARWAILEFELDCRARTHRGLATREYAPDGTLLRRNDQPDLASSPPGTEDGRANIDSTCRRAGWSESGAQ